MIDVYLEFFDDIQLLSISIGEETLLGVDYVHLLDEELELLLDSPPFEDVLLTQVLFD